MDANKFIKQAKSELGLKFFKWTPREGNTIRLGYDGCIDGLTLVSRADKEFKLCRLKVYQLKVPGYMFFGDTWAQVFVKLKYYASKEAIAQNAETV